MRKDFQKIRSELTFRTILLLEVLLLFLSPAYGILGGSENSVRADREAVHGQEKMITRESYKVYVITVEGRVIREYVLPTGKVFAVSWQGYSQPDLSMLLGKYFEEYKNGVLKQRVQKRGVINTVKTDRMILEQSGHMRNVRGKAYIPNWFPDGFTTSDIH